MKRAPSDSLATSSRLLKAFADPVRLRLLNLLADREVCVCHLHGALDVPQPTVSRHLAYLRKAGLVVGRKDGLWVHYRLAKPGSALHRALLDAVCPCIGALEGMKEDVKRLERVVCC